MCEVEQKVQVPGEERSVVEEDTGHVATVTLTKVMKKRKSYCLYDPSQGGLNSFFSLGSLLHHYLFSSTFILYSNIVVSHFVSVSLNRKKI